MSDHMLDAEQAIAKLRADNCRLVDDCNDWQQQSQLHYNNLQRMIGKCDALVVERDAALVEVRSQLAEIRVISVDRDSAHDHNGFLREKCQKLEAERDAARAECEGLRADLLAHPPEPHQELAIERKRHLELMEDYDRQNVMIGTLEDAIKRTENLLKVAVDDRLKGVLASISKLANEAEEML